MAGIRELLGSSESVGVWRVVPEQSTIGFKSKSMWGLVPVKGRFTEFSGDGQIGDGQTIFGRIDVKGASLETGIRKRDDHLRSADFFEVEKYPDASLVVTGADALDDDTVELRTQLTVKDTTKPLPLRAAVTVLGDDTVRLSTQATINRKDFGVDGNLVGMIGDKVTISGDVVFRRVASSP
jgi:polyisoprenoid-binding protein YceI